MTKLTESHARELEEARNDMQAYLDLLPADAPERAEYEQEIGTLNATLATYARAQEEANEDVDDADEDIDDVELDPETQEGLAALRAQLEGDGYDVGDDETDLVDPARAEAPRTYSVGLQDMLREDVDRQIDDLLEGEHLLPYQADQARAACYALLHSTPEGGVSGGLRVYSREDDGATPPQDMRAAVRDLLDIFAERRAHGMARTYTRAESAAAGSAPVNLNLAAADDVPVNQNSARIASEIQSICAERGVGFAEATRIYERERGKADLRRY